MPAVSPYRVAHFYDIRIKCKCPCQQGISLKRSVWTIRWHFKLNTITWSEHENCHGFSMPPHWILNRILKVASWILYPARSSDMAKTICLKCTPYSVSHLIEVSITQSSSPICVGWHGIHLLEFQSYARNCQNSKRHNTYVKQRVSNGCRR